MLLASVLITAALIGLAPAYIARDKGRSFGLWWLYGAMLFIIALPHSIMLRRIEQRDHELYQPKPIDERSWQSIGTKHCPLLRRVDRSRCAGLHILRPPLPLRC